MKIKQATEQYERWLAQHTPLVRKDLALKHAAMKRDAFSFLRATFYRWIQVWPNACGDVVGAPRVLAIGDLHVENFGTWRDCEGRLIWGINDFDEASSLPYTNDLVRLAVSAKLATQAEHLSIKAKHVYDAVLTGYVEGLQAGGRPFVLAEGHGWLRRVATGKLRDPVQFWKKMNALPPAKAVPADARKALTRLMPEQGLAVSIRRRVSGLGSLGRPRFVALADWHGGKIAREAKALGPSACTWAGNGRACTTIMYQAILDHAVRCRDPFVHVQGSWLVRRLSPYCSRIELPALPKRRDEGKLLYAMGWETANAHLGSRKTLDIHRDLAKRTADWLSLAANAMVNATLMDWTDWTNT
ncbi:MAG: DUF2252 domain-containing protein [Nitrospirota bacterium]|nr:DUF2252 domain-containing protein [Nitrospirota bacterium]